jgi:hypothetical protein
MQNKRCTKCEKTGPLEDFAINSKGKFGRKSVCKVCSNNAQKQLARQRKKEDPFEWAMFRREKALKSSYGLSLTDYENLFAKQGGLCKICGQPGSLKTCHTQRHDLYVDHCHKSGAIRGLLCQKCNTILGLSGDSCSVLLSAVDYLNNSKVQAYGI